MPKRALVEKRPFLLAAIAVALAFYYLRSGPWPELWFIPLKGGALALLALYAYVRHSSQDAKLLAVMMLIAGTAEMLLEFDGIAGHVLYFGYDVVALMLYLRHKRASLARSQKLAVAALLIVPALVLPMVGGRPGGDFLASAYGLAAGGMAAGAWASSFPRYRVGAGAVLLLLSDLLYFAGLGPLAASSIPPIFVWPLTFLGHFLVCTGVIQTLRKRDPELRLVSSRDDYDGD